MNAWLARFLAALDAEGLEPPGPAEVGAILDLAGTAARSSSQRQFAPVATYLAGIAAAAEDTDGRLDVLHRAAVAATEAGEAAEPPVTDAARDH